MMMAPKRLDGRYHLDGYVQESPAQKNIGINFVIDTSQRHTIISNADAQNNLIKLDTLEVQGGWFEVGNESINAYVYPNCEIRIPRQNKDVDRFYRETVENVYIPFKKLSSNREKVDFSRLGLDFLEKFKISFHTLELDRDQVMVLRYPSEEDVKII